MHAYAARYYAEHNILRKTLAASDPSPELPNMKRAFQGSALVALSAFRTCCSALVGPG